MGILIIPFLFKNKLKMYAPPTFFTAGISYVRTVSFGKKTNFLRCFLILSLFSHILNSFAQTPTNGGGGGTFVVKNSGSVPMIIAGGGGGASGQCCTVTLQNGNPGVVSNAGTASTFGCASIAIAGTNGNGGSTYSSGAGSGSGGGFLTNGGSATGGAYVGSGGAAYLNGGLGGNGWISCGPVNIVSMSVVPGGFGGGGGAGHNGAASNFYPNGSGGGGGGYSGGGGGGASCNWSSGGGGGSYNSGTSQANYNGIDAGFGNTGDGSVIINWAGGNQVFGKVHNSIQSFTVPSGITSVTIIAKGAQGGSSLAGTYIGGNFYKNVGGKGAYMSGTFAVTPGDVLNILVGETPEPFNGVCGVNCITPATVNVSGGGTFCGSTVISASGGSGGTIYFQGTNSNGTSTANPSVSQTITNSGTYYFRSQAAAGCWGIENSVTVTIIPLPIVAAITGTTNVCSGSTTQLDNSTGGGIWSSSNNAVAMVNSSGLVTGIAIGTATISYALTANGCTNTATVLVTIHPLPASTITASGTISFCPGGSVTLTAGAGSVYLWNNGAVTQSILVNTSGSYSVKTTNVNGCAATSPAIVITVQDLVAPVISAPANVTVSADAGACAATNVSLGSPSVNDNCGIASITNNAPLSFSVGNSYVTWTVKDNSGNTTIAVQTVTVNDNEKPTIIAPGSVSVVNDPGKCGASIFNLGIPQTADNCGVAIVTNNAPASSFFPVGTTIVTWTVRDIHANVTDTAKQLVTVIDNELPTITIPNVSIGNDSGICGATINLGIPQTGDNCGIAVVINNHPSSFFPVGTTYVTWTVTDNNAWTKTFIQTVTVIDNEKPVVKTKDITIQLNLSGNAGIVSSQINNGSFDNCGIAGYSINKTDFTCANIGENIVTLTVTDVNGNFILYRYCCCTC